MNVFLMTFTNTNGSMTITNLCEIRRRSLENLVLWPQNILEYQASH